MYSQEFPNYVSGARQVVRCSKNDDGAKVLVLREPTCLRGLHTHTHTHTHTQTHTQTGVRQIRVMLGCMLETIALKCSSMWLCWHRVE